MPSTFRRMATWGACSLPRKYDRLMTRVGLASTMVRMTSSNCVTSPRTTLAGVAVHPQLGGCPVCIELCLQTRGMGRRRVRVFLTEEGQQRTRQGRNHVDRRHRALRRMLVLDDKATCGIDSRIQIGALAGED